MLSRKEVTDTVEKGSDDTKYVLRTLAEDEAYQKTLENTLIAKKTGEIHSQYDVDILEATGIEKVQGEKTYEYNKRAFKELKAKLDAKSESKLQDKITELEGKLEKGADAVTKQELELARQALADKNTEFDTAIKGKDDKIKALKVSHNVNKALVGIKIKSEIPEAAAKALVDATVKSLVESGQENEAGEVVYSDENGNLLIDPKTAKPKTAVDILTERLETIIDVGKKIKGTEGKNEDKSGEVLPDDIKTKDDLTKWIVKLGHPTSTKEHTELYNKHRDTVK